MVFSLDPCFSSLVYLSHLLLEYGLVVEIGQLISISIFFEVVYGLSSLDDNYRRPLLEFGHVLLVVFLLYLAWVYELCLWVVFSRVRGGVVNDLGHDL